MKKLMIAAAIVCAAAFAQAATISWDQTSGCVLTPEFGIAPDATTYLIYSSTISQSDLVDGWVAGYETTVAGYAADTTDLVSGQFSVMQNTVASLPAEGDGAYFVLFNGDNMYVSEEEYFAYNDMDKDYGILFDTQDLSFSQYDAKTDGYQTQGWYQSVPEPTTGLLMLLGMAGLALRRRRA